jgi:hypothetical protein
MKRTLVCAFIIKKSVLNPLTANDLQRRRAVNPLKIKIPSKNMHQKPTNTPIIHSFLKLCTVAPT